VDAEEGEEERGRSKRKRKEKEGARGGSEGREN